MKEADELTVEERQEKSDMECKELVKESINHLFSELNYMGNEGAVEKFVVLAIQNQHRTLQQKFFGNVIIAVIKDFAKRYDEGRFDLRNEASCKLAKSLEPMIKDFYLPFI